MPLLRINAAAAIDGAGTVVSPASLLIDCQLAPAPIHEAITLATRGPLQLLHLGAPSQVDSLLKQNSWSPAQTIDRPNCVLTPAFVNAHTHLDLTHIGPREFDPTQGFTGFIKSVLASRLTDEAQIAQSIQRGVSLSLKGGVIAVGDIGGVIAGQPSLAPYRALQASPMQGVSFLEFFGLGTTQTANIAALDAVIAEYAKEHARNPRIQHEISLGLQPHAPYTASPTLYLHAAIIATERGLRLCTHLAETPEEHEFIENATGPFRELLARVGWWPTGEHAGSITDSTGKSDSPVSYFAKHLLPKTLSRSAPPYLLAHVNDASDRDIALLAARDRSVVYSPRSSDYFHNHTHFGPHRYRDMLNAGINVCLGTDSVINLPNAHRISTLDEMRFLFRRDELDPQELLAMATVRGAKALGLNESMFCFVVNAKSPPHTIAGIVSIPIQKHAATPTAHRTILECDTDPELLAISSN